MKRRDLLKQAAATAAVAGIVASSEGCATVPRRSTPRDDQAAANYLALLDHSLALTGKMRPANDFAARLKPGERTPAQRQVIDDNDAMFQKLMRTLFITQSFRDLPEDTQVHPAVQERIASHLDEVDRTVFELTDYLGSRTPAQRVALRDLMRKHPQTAMDLAQELDTRAAKLGVGKDRRAQLRQIMKHATFRMRTEAPGALIDEYTDKVQRLRGTDGNNALALALAQKVGEKQFWRYEQHLAQDRAASSTRRIAVVDPDSPPPAPPMRPYAGPSAAPVQPAQRSGQGVMRAGGYMMGIGLLDFGLGALIVSNASSSSAIVGIALVGGITVGALLVAIGFITLIVGAVMD